MDTLTEQSVLQVEAIMEMLVVCIRTTRFQVDYVLHTEGWHG
jgi:hypothetical protein